MLWFVDTRFRFFLTPRKAVVSLHWIISSPGFHLRKATDTKSPRPVSSIPCSSREVDYGESD